MKSSINLVVILHMNQFPQFDIHIGAFFIFSTSKCIYTSWIMLSLGTSSGILAYSASTPSKLGHTLMELYIAMSDRIAEFYLNHTTILA